MIVMSSHKCPCFLELKFSIHYKLSHFFFVPKFVIIDPIVFAEACNKVSANFAHRKCIFKSYIWNVSFDETTTAYDNVVGAQPFGR